MIYAIVVIGLIAFCFSRNGWGEFMVLALLATMFVTMIGLGIYSFIKEMREYD